MSKFIDAWKESSIAKMKEIKPDIVVYDIMSRNISVGADILGVPKVLNCPAGPMNFF